MLYFWITMASTLGVVIGAVLSNVYRHKKSASGTLKVNTTDPDGPYLFLELSKEDLANITHKKQVVLDVKITTQK